MTEQITPTFSRRERQREETRRDLATMALELASERGLANVRVPDIAAAAGVSTRTFNNYFPSKEAAIAWPAMSRATLLADDLIARPVDESLRDALIAAVTRQGPAAQDRVQPSEWAAKLRTLVAREPTLVGEYLKAFAATEHALARAIAVRSGTSDDELWPKVLAAMVVSAERAAIRHWIQLDDPNVGFDATVREALEQALAGVER